MTKKNLQFFLLRPDNIFKIIINKDFSVCQKLSKTRFLSKNVSSAGFHFDGIIGVYMPEDSIFDDIIIKMNFLCITSGIEILKTKIGQICPFFLMVFIAEVG